MLENEKSVIGACFIDQFGVDGAMSILKPDHFSVVTFRQIFSRIIDLVENNDPVDIVTVSQSDQSLADIIMDCIEFVPTSANVAYYANQVLKSYQSRQLLEIGSDLEQSADDDPSEVLERIDQQLLKLSGLGERKYTHIKDAIKSATSLQDKTGFLGLRTYWPQFDRQFSGLCPGSLYCIAGRPGMGKTAFASCLSVNVARKHPVAYFTLEMSKEEVSTRMICSAGSVNITKARNRELDSVDRTNWLNASADLASLPIYIDDSGSLSISQLRSKVRMMKRKYGIELLVVDYLQLMSGTGDTRQQEIGSISRGLKLIAKDLQIPVVMLSQLNRKVEDRPNKRPIMSDLRESGDIEQDCDAVIMLYRDEVYNENANPREAEWLIRKNRNGALGFIDADWQGEYCYYTEAQ